MSTLHMLSSEERRFRGLRKYNLLIFTFLLLYFVSFSRNLCLPQSHEDIFLCYSLDILTCFTFRIRSHLDLFLWTV